MRRCCNYSTVLCLLAVSLCHGMASQGEQAWVAGEIEGNTPRNDLAAELYDHSRHTVVGRVPVGTQGTFEFGQVPAGQYELRITGRYRDVVASDFINVHPGAAPVRIRLPRTDGAKPVAGTVSLARLAHRPPAKASREFAHAWKAMRAADPRKSISHYEAALRIDPDYFEARNNLGSVYMQTGEYDKAVAEFERAAGLDPAAADAVTNLAGALGALHRYHDAEAAARRAIVLEPGFLKAYYFAGLIRHLQHKDDEETLRALERAAAEIPNARLVMVEILSKQGAIEAAIAQLQAYLDSGAVEHRKEAAASLASLRKKVKAQ